MFPGGLPASAARPVNNRHLRFRSVTVPSQETGLRMVAEFARTSSRYDRTVNGGVHSDFEGAGQDHHNKNLSVQVGSGGATIHTSTVNGGVHISQIA